MKMKIFKMKKYQKKKKKIKNKLKIKIPNRILKKKMKNIKIQKILKI